MRMLETIRQRVVAPTIAAGTLLGWEEDPASREGGRGSKCDRNYWRSCEANLGFSGSQYPDILYQDIAGMRSNLIHDYFNADIDIIWKAVQEDVPQLKITISGVSEDFSSRS